MKRKQEGNRIFWLTTGRKEGIQTRQGMNCQGHGILVLVAGIPNADTDKFDSESACTVGKSPSMDPGGYPHQV